MEHLSDSEFYLGEYTWTAKGIGGKIKSTPEDFIVIELDSDGPIDNINFNNSESGLFIAGKVWKKKIDHNYLVKQLARTFKVLEEDVSTAGIKDAKAETLQLFSIYHPAFIPSDPYQPVQNMEISNFHFRKEKVYPGSMKGNFFQIRIQDCTISDNEILLEFGKWASNGILNYFGYQRFGSSRPVTGQIGRLLNQNKFEEAIDLYLGAPTFGQENEFRDLWLETKDPKNVLDSWINIPLIERTILVFLVKSHNDYRNAVKKFPEYLRRLFTSAFISQLTNEYLSQRGLDVGLQKGERIINNNIEIALPSRQWPKPLNPMWEDVFAKFELNMEELNPIKHSSRMLKSFVNNWNIIESDEDEVTVSFELGVGCYATTVLRELMKSPPLAYF